MTDPGEPLFTVMAGRPDDAELAAVAAVLAAVVVHRRHRAHLRPVAPPPGRVPPAAGSPGAWTASDGRHLGETG